MQSHSVHHASGIAAKQPNSAIRKCDRVQLIKNGNMIVAFVFNDGFMNYIEENDEVLLDLGVKVMLWVQGRQGFWCFTFGPIQGEEGEAKILIY
ncbi:unnamed protein product [Eruca vesicaria subsp. sativa]|uniref:S12 n=1 Tax=Eruca vesicaria subsp. sativa TaxID=29727 RepID=A0ABC8JTY6_ERUVS|nr:unnamed protein product [Eruca vesicaria subsp. sativa]